MKEYYGWRAKVGLVYMASSTVMEPEFYAMAPEGVSIHTDRIVLPTVTVAGLEEMMDGGEVARCTSFLAKAPLDVIIFGGTSATFLKGPTWDEAIKQTMAAASRGIPVTTTSTASVRALKALGARKISIATPYTHDITALAKSYFEQNEFEVLSVASLGLDDDHAIGAVPLQSVYEFARVNSDSRADALFLSCTNLRTVGAIEDLERVLGVPVVSAVQASFWDCMGITGVSDAGVGFGKLFRRGQSQS
jgi:maleate isomerase